MKIRRQVAAVLFLALLAAAFPVFASDDEAWFLDDFEERTAEVNEGELEFLSSPPKEPVHHHRNTLILDEGTLEDGWARLTQCHDHLDAVPRAEVTFREGHLRNLVITESRGIGRAWVAGTSVQLLDVEPGARLCLSAESRVLSRNADGSYSVRNGPYMRRFLDGYYPMRVSVQVYYPCDRLRMAGHSPPAQRGFSVTRSRCGVHFDAFFQGRLKTELHFTKRHF